MSVSRPGETRSKRKQHGDHGLDKVDHRWAPYPVTPYEEKP
ncbi:hypothetical protein [Nocardioides sp. CFH 31398]|nr:hypothetical protein [Nocardioides sp. CFH 31398]